MMNRTIYRMAIAVVGFGLMAGQGRASLVTFVGEDLQPTLFSAVRTNSDAAAAAFLSAASAIGTPGTIDFELAPLGPFSNLSVAPGVTMNGLDSFGNNQTIRNTSNSPTIPALDGSNTTAGGARFVEMFGGSLTFTFATPTQFFGVYLTGVQTNFFADTVTFNDGTTQNITLAGAGTSGSVGEIAFIGFTNAGKFITSVTIVAGDSSSGDFIGIDDVVYQAAPGAAVPEPSTLALGSLAALIGLGYARSRRPSNRKPSVPAGI